MKDSNENGNQIFGCLIVKKKVLIYFLRDNKDFFRYWEKHFWAEKGLNKQNYTPYIKKFSKNFGEILCQKKNKF